MPCRNYANGDVVVHGFADLLTHPAPNTMFRQHGEPKSIEIHPQSIRGASRDARLTTLVRGAETVRYNGDAHSHITSALDRQQRIGLARGNAWKIVAQMTGSLVGKDHRGAVSLIE